MEAHRSLTCEVIYSFLKNVVLNLFMDNTNRELNHQELLQEPCSEGSRTARDDGRSMYHDLEDRYLTYIHFQKPSIEFIYEYYPPRTGIIMQNLLEELSYSEGSSDGEGLEVRGS